MLLNTVGHWIKLDQSLRKSPTLCSFIFLCLCWVLVPWPHGSVFPLLHLCCFFLPFRIRIGHPWNYQASSCLISCVKLKLPLWPPHRLTWLQPCGSVNVRISESGKKISLSLFILMTKADHPTWHSESMDTSSQAQVHIKVSTTPSCKSYTDVSVVSIAALF